MALTSPAAGQTRGGGDNKGAIVTIGLMEDSIIASSTADAPSYDAIVDARGLACPLPLVKARQALMMLPGGAVLCVLATDPGAPRDFEEFCEHAGHELIETREADGLLKIVFAKADG